MENIFVEERGEFGHKRQSGSLYETYGSTNCGIEDGEEVIISWDIFELELGRTW